METVVLKVLKAHWNCVQSALNEIGDNHEEYPILLDMTIEIENQVMEELSLDIDDIDEMMKFLTS